MFALTKFTEKKLVSSRHFCCRYFEVAEVVCEGEAKPKSENACRVIRN